MTQGVTMNYWDRTLARRITRRRAVASAGGTALTTFLVACGADDGSNSGPSATTTSGSGTGSTGGTGGGNGASNELVTQPVDTFAQAVPGGTLKEVVDAESQTLDPARPQPNLNRIGTYLFSTMLVQAPGHLKAADPTEMSPDFAEGWEISPDRMQITLKLRPEVHWHNKAPVNGRLADIDDVLFSWNRYVELSPFALLADNGTNPDAPILSVNAADNNTITVQLDHPLAYAL